MRLTLNYICFFFLFTVVKVTAQDDFQIVNVKGKKDTVYYSSSVSPSFQQGSKVLLDSLAALLFYPELARRRIEGAFVEGAFVVNKKGFASGVNALTASTNPEFSQEVIQKFQSFIARHAKEWSAGSNNNLPVNAYYAIEVAFFPQLQAYADDENKKNFGSFADTIVLTDILTDVEVRKVVVVQDKKLNTVVSKTITEDASNPETPTEFKGGTSAMMRYLRDTIKYPAIARENNIQGKIEVSFVVNEEGEISFIKILSDTHPLLNNCRVSQRYC